jgi:uncharacterized protein (DUF2141 family)
MTKRPLSVLAGLLALTVAAGVAQEPPPAGQTPPQGRGQGAGRGARQAGARDRAQLPKGTAVIAGRVLTADTGRPVKRARVVVTGGGRGGQTSMTDDQGRYRIDELGAGNYMVTASKTGFVDSVFGQRRPLQPGSPVVVAEAQGIENIDLRLTRGGVITGRLMDEDGEPLARALVTVQRYRYVAGERQLTPAGADQTDDRGQYRVFGLPPGEYFVSASTAGLAELLGRGMQQLAAGIGALGGRGGGGRGGAGLGGGALAALGVSDEPEASGYAPTYYPGVVGAPEAGKVNVAPGQEVGSIDFQILLVPFATVSGIVGGGDGTDSVAVMLMPQDDSNGGRGPMGAPLLTGRAQADGTFSIRNVPPGRYMAIARLVRADAPATGMQTVVVNGQNIGGVSLMLQPGGSLSGHITVESSGTPAPADYSSFRVDAPDVTPLPFGGGGGRVGGGRGGGAAGNGRVEKNGAFRLDHLLPGKHHIRVTGGGAQGAGQWTLKSVSIGGQDVTDAPVELKPGENVENITVVLTDRTTEITGTVRDAKGAGAAALTVIAFSTDQQHWRAQSRRIQAARTDQSGTFRLRNLPPGDYLVIASDDVEQGEWFDPAFLEQARAGAKQISISEGEKTTLDLRGPSAP